MINGPIPEGKTPREAFEACKPYHEKLLLTDKKGAIALKTQLLPADGNDSASTPVNVQITFYYKPGIPDICAVSPGLFFTN